MLAQSHRAPVASPGAAGVPRYNRRPSAAIPFRMNVLFEDDGQLKAGSVLADHDASLQVEAASGKRLKIKASNVLLRFATPGAAEKIVVIWIAAGRGPIRSMPSMPISSLSC